MTSCPTRWRCCCAAASPPPATWSSTPSCWSVSSRRCGTPWPIAASTRPARGSSWPSCAGRPPRSAARTPTRTSPPWPPARSAGPSGAAHRPPCASACSPAWCRRPRRGRRTPGAAGAGRGRHSTPTGDGTADLHATGIPADRAALIRAQLTAYARKLKADGDPRPWVRCGSRSWTPCSPGPGSGPTPRSPTSPSPPTSATSSTPTSSRPCATSSPPTSRQPRAPDPCAQGQGCPGLPHLGGRGSQLRWGG